jgi:hypothetical protein
VRPVLELRAPGGDELTVRLPDGSPVTSTAAEIRFVGNSYSRGFQIGPHGYHQFACRYLIRATTRDRFLVDGREIVVSGTSDGDTTMVTMRERYHEVSTVFSGPSPDRPSLAALFDTVDIDDHPRGLRLRPVSVALVDVTAERLVLNVSGRGAVSIPGPRHTRAILPSHRGASTRFGELWRTPLPGRSSHRDSRDFMYVIAGARGAAQVHVDESSPLDGPGLLTWVSGLDVAWHTG